MRTLNDYFVTSKITTISTAGSTFVPVPDGGRVIKIITSIKNAITTADAALTWEIGGVAMTDSAITVTQSGSAAGDVDTSEPTALNTVSEDGTIEMITDGASATACECVVTFIIRR
jgi:hypothetical protein|tara:strand:- start:351 stop:698 length:348 start_codon:yes stop_codon:yes gene_type:complete